MPVSKKSGETKNNFVSRCIKHEVNKGHEQQQAIAMCESMWISMRKIEDRLTIIKEYRKKCKPK